MAGVGGRGMSRSLPAQAMLGSCELSSVASGVCKAAFPPSGMYFPHCSTHPLLTNPWHNHFYPFHSFQLDCSDLLTISSSLNPDTPPDRRVCVTPLEVNKVILQRLGEKSRMGLNCCLSYRLRNIVEKSLVFSPGGQTLAHCRDLHTSPRVALPLIMYLNVLTGTNAFKLKCLEDFMKQILPGVVPRVKDQGTNGISPSAFPSNLSSLKE